MLLAALSFLLVSSPEPIERFHAGVFDAYQRLFPLERTAEPVVIVAIDEHSLREFGQWPWPRTRVAELIRRIGEGKPGAIGFDLFFPEPDRFSPGNIASTPGMPGDAAKVLMSLPTNDSVLSEAIASQPVLLGISAERELDPRFPAPPPSQPLRTFAQRELPIDRYAGHIGNLPVLGSAAKGYGLINSGSASAIVRRAPLIARVGEGTFGSLGLETLRQALGEKLTVREAPHGMISIEFGEVKTLAQDDGTAWIRFGPHDGTRFVTAYDVMLNRLKPGTFEGKAVLVGVTGLGLLDFKTTPLGELVPGVEVHAQVAENLAAGVYLQRWERAARIEGAFLLALGLLFIVVVPRLRAQRGLALVVGSVGGTLVAGLVAFAWGGLLFDPVLPAFGAVAVFGMVLVGTLAQSERQRRVLREQAARLAGELDAARRIQMGLLPDPAEIFADERRIEMAALLEPARTVGGDFYDCFMVGADRVVFVVADVSGKGLPAALFMASVKSHLKSAALRGGEAGVMLTRAQEEISRENPEQLFVTAFLGSLDLETGMLECANAGHEPPYARTPNGTPERLVPDGGPPLCVIEGYVFPTWKRRLMPGEWMCVVTDGATESQNPRGEFFGTERLKVSLGWMPEDVTPDFLVRKVRDDVHRFAEDAEQADDLTLLALKWNGGTV
ncbi:CHASE2 domain-containing protein [Usitatibacter palustris]|uniref:Serine phosphatase RsbU, regulator of sigma subunit n=1 Tax=Usitatibacter palustris TaxID=2732487 RepID=A0A6M4HDS8_9PROT|nr:CHASE2 domain-containing protein [Usitatibacter palustris]QJR16653.1 hypothetical protein DSM104440_03488 [Usitatibacter palustris]